ncbi:MAG: hypothetical protein FJ211_09820 [Ignavibacteria bacterium]|nr:hypothetical protein [Ignavibacteria bacterium]
MAHHDLDTAKTVADVAAVATTVGTLAQVLPSIAALFTIVWTGFRIYETDTVQGWLGKKPPQEQD